MTSRTLHLCAACAAMIGMGGLVGVMLALFPIAVGDEQVVWAGLGLGTFVGALALLLLWRESRELSIWAFAALGMLGLCDLGFHWPVGIFAWPPFWLVLCSIYVILATLVAAGLAWVADLPVIKKRA